jgi:hypothetical protein
LWQDTNVSEDHAASIFSVKGEDGSSMAFRAVKIQGEVFWVVTPCSVVARYQCFKGPYRLHLQVHGCSGFIKRGNI